MKKHVILKEVLYYSRTILTALIIAYSLNSYIIANAEVPSGSMETTVMTGDRIIINRLAYKNQDPQRGDIISFSMPDDETQNYLKRIIGLPGETVQGIQGVVYIDGTALVPDFTDQKIDEDFGPYTVPEGSYFVMGDNRRNSYDSRYWEHKFVALDAITGRAEFCYYPEFRMLR